MLCGLGEVPFKLFMMNNPTTLAIPKSRFKSSEYELFEWLQCLDTCTYQNPVRNSIVQDIHDSLGDSLAVFVFDNKREPAGFAYAGITGNEMFIEYISCKEKRQGHGSALVHTLEQFARSCGIRKVDLVSTVGAKGFYETHGYVFGPVESKHRKSLRIARMQDPDKLLPFVKYL